MDSKRMAWFMAALVTLCSQWAFTGCSSSPHVNVGSGARAQGDYFPPGILDPDLPDLDAFIRKWYTQHLSAMQEPSLLCAKGERQERYRLLWLRTFHHPIAVRVEREDRSYSLWQKELDGAGGYQPGQIKTNASKMLSEAQWRDFLILLDRAHFWELPAREKTLGVDGAQWVVEGCREGRYHVVDRWGGGAVQGIGLYLLKLSDLNIDPIY